MELEECINDVGFKQSALIGEIALLNPEFRKFLESKKPELVALRFLIDMSDRWHNFTGVYRSMLFERLREADPINPDYGEKICRDVHASRVSNLVSAPTFSPLRS